MNTYILNAIPVIAAALMAVVAVRWAYFKILHIAKEKGLVDNPDCCMVQVPRGMYHTCRCLELESVIFESKDRAYDPEKTEDFL